MEELKTVSKVVLDNRKGYLITMDGIHVRFQRLHPETSTESTLTEDEKIIICLCDQLTKD